MRTILLALFLAAPPADAAVPDDPPVETPAAAAAATVLEHHERITIDGGRGLWRRVRWSVRVDDPARCAAGLLVPPGLDGARDGAAQVFEDTLVLPPDVAPGDVFTLEATRRAPPGGHSDGFSSAPDLPVRSAVLEITAPAWVPLHVWFDANARPSWSPRGGRSVRLEWEDLPAGTSAEAVWSTWRDWIEAGRALDAHVSRRLADKHALGRVLAADISGLDVPSILDRVKRAVALEPGPTGDWSTARPAVDVVRSGRGTSADRAVVLLSLLRLAGYDASPGSYRPAADGVDFPVTVPAPGMLPRPVVLVDDDDGMLYLDPASELAAPGDVPAAMAGAMVWRPGDVPTQLRLPTLFDGTVAINGSLQIGGDGSASWTATISATGAANERLRALLAPLDERGRAEALGRLLRVARPGLTRFTASTTGTEHPSKRLRISVTGHDDGLLEPRAGGLAGEVPPLLAPALAAWLPPNIRVVETLAITPPPHLQVLGTHVAESAATDEALVSVRHAREGQRQVLTVEAERPYRRTSPARDSAAQRFLHEVAPRGLETMLIGSADPAGARVIRSSPLPADERALLEALLWWSVEDDRRAAKALERAGDLPMERIFEVVDHWVAPGNPIPARSLAMLAARRKDPRQQSLVEAWRARAVAPAPAAPPEPADARSGLRQALTDARLTVDDAGLWRRAAEVALRAGDAPAAGHAARRASDLAPDDAAAARLLATASAILGDREGHDLARRRLGEQGRVEAWPPTVDQLVATAPDAMYAILAHRDEEVSADPRLLAIRAQQHVDAGRLDDAARDGVLLAERHGRPEGWGLAFAATAGRLYSSALVAALDRAASADPAARLTRMEFRLVSGLGDPTDDARALDDPRAEVVARLRTDPRSVAADVEGWPVDAVDARLPAPAGYRVHRLLDALPGVHAWSDPDGATAVLRVAGPPGVLPPPLAQLYTPAPEGARALPGGARVLRLDGGMMPLYAATGELDGATVLGLGFTPEAAARALGAGTDPG